MKLKKALILIICLLLFINTNCTYVLGSENYRVDARCAIAMDSKNREILFEQNAYEIVPMASTTKILTALITIESGNLNEEFTVSKNAASVRGSKVGYTEGEKLSKRELLYGLMFRSGNDAAITLAEGIGKDIDGFAEIMNNYARSIGITDSHFESPHGLDSNAHYSSAYDLALLAGKAMEYNEFREIVGSKCICKDKYNFTREYSNINKILYKIQGANGIKTGYTGGAGKCLVSSVNSNGRDIIIVVLNCPDRWNVTEDIYKHVLESVAFQRENYKELV